MSGCTRRRFLEAAAVGAAAVGTPAKASDAERSADRRAPVAMLHATDLFHPHNDPDDHWDLACVYALAYHGLVDLKGILIDYPVPGRRNDPDAMGVAQMNFITGKAAAVMVGPPAPMKSRDDLRTDAPEIDHAGVRWVLEVLRGSPRPVVINVTGCCLGVAIAGKQQPDLFARKCAAVYLNAGTGSPDRTKAGRLEYNVKLDPAAYAAIFDLPCPVYWMPCFEELASPPGGERQVMQFGTYYRFRQGEILPHLSDRVQNFFAFMYRGGRTAARDRSAQSDWLRYLVGPKDVALLAQQGATYRNMWCTGGFLHAAGRTVTTDGRIVALDEAGDSAVFTFDPIHVSCNEQGATEWSRAQAPKGRYLFHVRDTQSYAQAMTTAMKSLLMTLP
jgi:hypothetical protein